MPSRSVWARTVSSPTGKECASVAPSGDALVVATRLSEGGQAGTKLGTLFRVIAALDLDVQIAPRSKGGADLTEIF